MKKHNGMRPQDIAVLMKIAAKQQQEWYMKDLAYELEISASEVSESINRSIIAGLISQDKRSLKKLALLDFLQYGFQYVYPQQLGAIVRGIATAHSAAPLNDEIMSDTAYVWPYPNGDLRGQSLEPLYPNLPSACLKDSQFYELMALIEAIRIGKVREKSLAIKRISERLEMD